MPSYELTVLFRALPKHELVPCLKRVSEAIFNKNGMIRSIEHLGTKPTLYKMRAHDQVFREASFFIIKFESDTQAIAPLEEEYTRDIDIVRKRFYLANKLDKNVECTLHDELQPPAYRKDVQEMIEMGKKQGSRFTYKFKYNSGFSYYPFQK